MGFFFSGLFWGIIIVLVGLSIILDVVFGVKIPLFRIALGIVLIYWGVSFIAGSSFRWRRGDTSVFSSTKTAPSTPSKEYNIIFGKGEVDLTKVVLKPGENRTEINTVFGSCELLLDSAVPTKLVVSSAFGGARMPDGNTIAFGEYTWQSPGFKGDSGYLAVKASVVFGGLEVRVR